MLLYCSVVIAIFINIVLPQSVMPFVSNDEITQGLDVSTHGESGYNL